MRVILDKWETYRVVNHADMLKAYAEATRAIVDAESKGDHEHDGLGRHPIAKYHK